MVGRSPLCQITSTSIQDTSFYNTPEVRRQHQQCANRKNNLLIVFTGRRYIFAGIDSTGFKQTHASQYYIERAKLRRKYSKLSIGADVLQQIICNIKVRRAPRHDNVDFRPIITRIAEISPLSVVVGDKGYDSEDNHILAREKLHGFSVTEFK